jgi:hypothetical protein
MSETIGSDSAAQPPIDALDLLAAQTGSQSNPFAATVVFGEARVLL